MRKHRGTKWIFHTHADTNLAQYNGSVVRIEAREYNVDPESGRMYHVSTEYFGFLVFEDELYPLTSK